MSERNEGQMQEYKNIDKKYIKEVRQLKDPKKYRKWKIMRRIYRTIQVLLFLFAIVAAIGIYGSLAGKKGDFWEVAEIVGQIALGLLIITILFYLYSKGTISGESDDLFIHPSHKNLGCNVWHDKHRKN